MFDGMETAEDTEFYIAKANDCFTEKFKTPRKLFGDLWREGELALLFGGPGTGKTVLSTQIIESIARGREIVGFDMKISGSRVLYVDMAHSQTQFRMRYTHDVGGTRKSYRFSERFLRGRPSSPEKLVEWLRQVISEKDVRAVVIDDLDSLRDTATGTRRMIATMRQLRSICEETGVAILLLATSRRHGERLVSEADLVRGNGLFGIADSVFALGRHARQADCSYLIQTRSYAGPIKWNSKNAPVGRIVRREEGFLGMVFDERFAAKIPEERRQMICNIKWRRDVGASFRCIADELGISKTHAARLVRLWTPDMDPPKSEDEVDEEMLAYERRLREREAAAREQECLAAYRRSSDSSPGPDASGADLGGESGTSGPHAPPEPETAPATEFDQFAHLKRSLDKNGREILVEEEDERGQAVVFYRFENPRQLSRFRRDSFGISGKHVDGPVCFLNPRW